MGILAGSKRKTETPVASPTKAAASTKKTRTQYDYNDDEDSESFPEDQWSSDDTDSWSEMSVDGDKDQTCELDSPSDRHATSRSHQDSQNAEGPGRVPRPASIPYGRDLTKTKTGACAGCSCSRYGKQCNASACSCPGGAACHNPFNKLDLVALFGQDAVDLHPCFTTWVTKQPRLEEFTTMRTLFDIVFEAIVMLDEYKDNVSEPYLEWRTKWDGLTASERDRDAGLALKRELLRWGLTSRDSQSVYYSFCRRNGWVETDHEWHCGHCGGCRQWTEWHCLNCNQCSYGLTRPCGTCKGNGDRSPGAGRHGLDDDYHPFPWWSTSTRSLPS